MLVDGTRSVGRFSDAKAEAAPTLVLFDRNAMTKPDMLSFFRAWRSDPSHIGAIAPSGEALTRLMTRDITAASGPVIELGPGTGAFTRALVTAGVKPEDLTLVEYDHGFAALLARRFPGIRVLRMDATRLARSHLYEPASVGAVVSGLPLLNLPRGQIYAILAAAFGYLRPDAAFYQFTYGPLCPVPSAVLERLGLQATFVGRAFLNVPPATVYRITRRQAGQAAPKPLFRTWAQPLRSLRRTAALLGRVLATKSA